MIDLTDEETIRRLESKGFERESALWMEIYDRPDHDKCYEKHISLCPSDGIYDEWSMTITVAPHFVIASLMNAYNHDPDLKDGLNIFDSRNWLNRPYEATLDDAFNLLDIFFERLQRSTGLIPLKPCVYGDESEAPSVSTVINRITDEYREKIDNQLKLF